MDGSGVIHVRNVRKKRENGIRKGVGGKEMGYYGYISTQSMRITEKGGDIIIIETKQNLTKLDI